MAIVSLFLGIVALPLAFVIPMVALPCALVGCVLGSKSLKSAYRGMAIAGMVTSIIGVALNVTIFLFIFKH
jgi:hypothetical protein